MPHSAATASNSLPMLVVSGEATPVRASSPDLPPGARRHASDERPWHAGRPRRAPRSSHAQAIRHGCLTAAAPPGSRTGKSMPDPLEAASGRRAAARRPRPCRRRRSPCRRRWRPPRGPFSPCSARHAARCAWWCCTPTRRTPSSSIAYLVDRYSGWRSWATTAGSTANSRSKCAMPSRERAERLVVLEVADVVADPRAAALGDAEGVLQLGPAGEQRASPDVTGSGSGRGHVPARAAQKLRPPGAPRAPPSRRCASRSAGRAAGTGPRSRPAAREASSSRYAIGSSEMLPLVITSGPPTSASSRWWSGE